MIPCIMEDNQEKKNSYAKSYYRCNLEERREYNRKYYLKHKDRMNAYSRAYQKTPAGKLSLKRMAEAGRKRNIGYTRGYLMRHPCVECGENDIRCLEFDHVNGNKHQNISDMIWSPYSLNALVAEMEKCEIRCANCHKKRHRPAGRWSKWLTP